MMQTPLQTFLVLWTDLWLQGQWAQRWGGMMCTSPRRYPAGMPHHFISLLGWREGTCPAPHYSVSGKRRNTPPRKVDKEGFCSRSWCRWACRQSTSLWPHPVELERCILEQFLWNISANKRIVAGLHPSCLTWGTCFSSARANPQACPQNQQHSIVFAVLW